jgi:hypothetical protein
VGAGVLVGLRHSWSFADGLADVNEALPEVFCCRRGRFARSEL